MRIVDFRSKIYLFVFMFACSVMAEAKAPPETAGLWEYRNLISSAGEPMPLTGIFLIKNGKFMQQSIFNGEPFTEQDSMAHAGTIEATDAGLRLTANQTLFMSPTSGKAIHSAGVTQHDLQVRREGAELTLVFGSGTIQTLKHLGSAADMRIYHFDEGSLAFAEDYFILVIGDEESAVSGYGHYVQSGDNVKLDVIRWAESDGKTTRNLRNIRFEVYFDGEILELPPIKGSPARRFPVLMPASHGLRH